MAAWAKVKANAGASGIDGESIAAFEKCWADNLVDLGERLKSGNYLPPPVKRVYIPKKGGKLRPLGIPTVSDRVAQQAVRQAIEPLFESGFSDSACGYRRGRQAHGAIRHLEKHLKGWQPLGGILRYRGVL